MDYSADSPVSRPPSRPRSETPRRQREEDGDGILAAVRALASSSPALQPITMSPTPPHLQCTAQFHRREALQMTRSHSASVPATPRRVERRYSSKFRETPTLAVLHTWSEDDRALPQQTLQPTPQPTPQLAPAADRVETAAPQEQQFQSVNLLGERAPADQRAAGGEKGHPQACLFVASLSSARSDIDLHRAVTLHFQQWGTLMNVKVLKDWLNRPFAFVQFKEIRDAKRALVEAHNTVLHGRYIRVEQARVNRTLFVAKFTKTIGDVRDPSDIKSHVMRILETYGSIEDLTVLQNYQTGRSKGCGFVKFCYREDAIKAFIGLRTSYKWVAEWAANLDRGNVDVDHMSIFVGQLNQTETTTELLEEKFGQYGQIVSLQLVNRYPEGPGTRPAFAFIKYDDEEAASEAVRNENSKLWLGRSIRVQYRETGDFRLQRPMFGQEVAAIGGPGFFPARRGLPQQPMPFVTTRGPKMLPYSAGAGQAFTAARPPSSTPYAYRGSRAGYNAENARNDADYQLMPQENGLNGSPYGQYPVFYGVNPYESAQRPPGSYGPYELYTIAQPSGGGAYYVPPPPRQRQQYGQPGQAAAGSARFRPQPQQHLQPVQSPMPVPQQVAYVPITTAPPQAPPSCAASLPVVVYPTP
ncbi:hypothetical protein BDZ88DRAFT_504812 [Geranomyces variabilis]|nr:hypothetical protein BDZ88DRAFT_504812 [Geranomyces variabilis]KAJ3142209.1 hypothetical protein HDU90_004482 [Geranomyces variabilis]